MKSTSTKQKSSIEFKVTFEQEDFEPARLRALERLARRVKIPGFRKGRAPANVVEQYVDPNELADTMLDTMIRTNIPKLIADADIDPISIPHVDVMKHVPGDTAEIVIKIDIMPEVKLPDYRNMKVPFPEQKYAASDVDDVLNRIADSMSKTKVVKRAAKAGDQVIIDFKGLKDGKAFEGGSAKDYTLALGSNMFIPGFEEGIIGHATGDKFDLKLTFPKDYGAKHLAGQKVTFEVLVKQVNEVKVPPIDDELAKKAGQKNLAALRKEIEQSISEQQAEANRRQYADALLNEIISKSKTTLPENLVNDQTLRLREEMEMQVQQNGVSLDDYLAERKLTPEKYAAQLREMAERRVKGEIVLRKIADELAVKVTEAEVEQRLKQFLKQAHHDKELSEAERNQLMMRLRHDLRMDKTIAEIINFNLPKTKTKPARKRQ